MATATQLDGDRHTVGWRPPHFVVNLSHRLNNKDEIVPLEFLVCSSNYHFISRMAHTALSANSST